MAFTTDEALLGRVANDVSDAASQLRLGITLQALGHDAQALNPLLRATVLAPTDPNPWLQTLMALSMLGRDAEVAHAVAALRELDPSAAQMWFDGEDDEALRPFARLAGATYLIVVPGEVDQAMKELAEIAHDYAQVPVPRVQYTVGSAEAVLALFMANGGETTQALATLEALITRLETSADPRPRFSVANALLWRGGLLWQTGQRDEALAGWKRVCSEYGDDDLAQPLIAKALSRMAEAYGEMERSPERDCVLAELARRYTRADDPDLRRLAVAALLARAADGDEAKRGAETSLDAVADGFRGDPDPMIARQSAEARMRRWIRGRKRLDAGLQGRAVGAVLRALIAVRYRPRHGISEPGRTVSRRSRILARLLVVIGRAAQIGGIVAAAVFSIHSSTQGDTTDLRVVGCAAVVIAGGLAVVLGARIGGRFTVGSLALARTRLPRTAFSTLLALGVAWLSPAIARIGAAFVFGPTRATYDWLGDIGLPTWLTIVAMVPIAPVEVLVMIGLANLAVVRPARTFFGPRSAVVDALEGSFGTIERR